MKYTHRPSTPLTFLERLLIVTAILFVSHISFPQLTHGVIAAEPRGVDFSQAFVFSTQDVTGSVLTMPTDEGSSSVSPDDTKTHASASTRWVLVTAYSSTPDQTDSTPYIGAKGTFVRDGMIAANWLRFGTRVRMPASFGDKEFVVEDRMHGRFSDRIDIWMPTRGEAIAWGARWVKVDVLK